MYKVRFLIKKAAKYVLELVFYCSFYLGYIIVANLFLLGIFALIFGIPIITYTLLGLAVLTLAYLALRNKLNKQS